MKQCKQQLQNISIVATLLYLPPFFFQQECFRSKSETLVTNIFCIVSIASDTKLSYSIDGERNANLSCFSGGVQTPPEIEELRLKIPRLVALPK